ncbi:MAG TPA: hypothetical protein LFW21_05310 [Rickettsia endosymbiont of Pyrocoelia pectoralis]|nr:hypothetical protein [Rickettsia endosymbiont of Pyrocoelia pectoralis]
MIFLVVFLDTVDKPRYDTEGVFRSTQQCHTYVEITYQ